MFWFFTFIVLIYIKIKFGNKRIRVKTLIHSGFITIPLLNCFYLFYFCSCINSWKPHACILIIFTPPPPDNSSQIHSHLPASLNCAPTFYLNKPLFLMCFYICLRVGLSIGVGLPYQELRKEYLIKVGFNWNWPVLQI